MCDLDADSDLVLTLRLCPSCSYVCVQTGCKLRQVLFRRRYVTTSALLLKHVGSTPAVVVTAFVVSPVALRDLVVNSFCIENK